MNVQPHGVNRTSESEHHAGLAVYHPVVVACPFTEVSVTVSVSSADGSGLVVAAETGGSADSGAVGFGGAGAAHTRGVAAAIF